MVRRHGDKGFLVRPVETCQCQLEPHDLERRAFLLDRSEVNLLTNLKPELLVPLALFALRISASADLAS
jgi:hypothetical protein